jgi:hypothetical protein
LRAAPGTVFSIVSGIVGGESPRSTEDGLWEYTRQERSVNKGVFVSIDESHAVTVLKWVLAASILSTAVHYTDNFVAVKHFQGAGGASFPTVVRVAIVIAWPLLTALALKGYRRYRERRYHEARVALLVYSITGLSTAGHFVYGSPQIPPLFYATLFTDMLAGLSVLAFVAWSALSVEPRPLQAR